MNNRKVLRGDIESIKYYASIINQVFGGKVNRVKNPTLDSLLTVESHSIPIMGNPLHPKSVIMKVKLDRRNNTGSIHLDGGYEMLEWQVRTKSLCNSCANIKTLLGIMYCSEMLEPNNINVKSCRKYRFKKGE